MRPNKKTYIYIGLLFLLSSIFYIHIYLNYEIPSIKDILFWGALAIIVESLTIILPNKDMAISVGIAINIASIIVGGPFLGTTIVTLAFLFRCPNIPDRGYSHLFNTPYYITIFNVSQGGIFASVMGLMYIYTGGVVGEFHFLQTILILFVGMIVNSSIISGLVSITKGDRFFNIWIRKLYGMIPSSLAVGILGIIIALSFLSYGYGAVILFFGPLLLARYSFKLYVETRNLYISTIETLSKTMEAKDPYTSGHANRVEEYAVKLAEAYGLSQEKIENIKRAAVLHDIGKIAINDSILHKASRLTREEYEQIMKHPSVGADIISEIDFLKDVSYIVRYHHERYDGKGYPEGLKGDEVPIEAYILSIADSFDAMTTDRPYRKAFDKEAALNEIKDNAGSQFHPDLAEKFIYIMNN